MNHVRRRFHPNLYRYLEQQMAEHEPEDWMDRQLSRRNADPLGRERDYYWPNNDRLTKAGKMYKQDQRTAAWVVKDRLGRHHKPNLPESDDTSDEELFGQSRNQVIAQGLRKEAAKERDVAAEERAIGDKHNSAHFAQQAAETEEIGRAHV